MFSLPLPEGTIGDKKKKMKTIDKEILAIAIPSIVSNITVPLLGLIDVTIVGHMGDAAYIGAIAVGSMIFNVIYWIFGFLRMGTSGMTSQAYGAKDWQGLSRLLVRTLSVGVGVGVVFVFLQWFIREGALAVMQPTADIRTYAASYFNVCIWGAPAMLGLYGLTGWFIGMQNTKVPMAIAIFQNVVNIVASLSFVYLGDMKVEGVALGTLTAQWSGFVLGLVLLRLRYRKLCSQMSLGAFRDSKAMARFFTVNRDIFLRTLFLVAVNLFFTSAGAKQGALILAVNTLLFQLFTLFSYVMDGFAYAGEAVGGKYFGAHDHAAYTQTKRHLFAWAVALTVVYTLLYYIGGAPFLHLLTDDAHVIQASLDYLPWAVAIPVAGFAAFVWDGLFIGMTATRGMLISSFLSAIVFFVVYFLFSATMANHALWLALLCYLAMRGVVQTAIEPKWT